MGRRGRSPSAPPRTGREVPAQKGCGRPAAPASDRFLIEGALFLPLCRVSVLFCFKTLFLEQCQAHSKIEKKFRGFPHAPCPHARTDSPAAHLPRRSGTLVTVDDPPWTGTSSPPRLRGSHWGSLVVVYALWAWAKAACRTSVTAVSHRVVSRP